MYVRRGQCDKNDWRTAKAIKKYCSRNRVKLLLRVLAGDWWSARELALYKMAANAEHFTGHAIRPCTLNSKQPTLIPDSPYLWFTLKCMPRVNRFKRTRLRPNSLNY